MSPPLLAVRGLQVTWPGRGGRGPVRAVDGVDLDLHGSETLALVGESGSGKTSLARAVVRLQRPAAGRILLAVGHGHRVDLARAGRGELRRLRPMVQMVFQDPGTSLNPRLTVAATLKEPLRNFRRATGSARIRDRIRELLELVGLEEAHGGCLPHQLSGGQRQRVAIARALAAEPRVLVLDEAVSALDVSVQAQVVNLLMRRQQELGVAYLFITHDLGVVRALAHRVAVMRSGRLVEVAGADRLFAAPAHPYTRELLASVPDPSRAAGTGERGPASRPARGDNVKAAEGRSTSL